MNARAREASLLLCIVRRVIDLIPYVEILGGIVRTDFDILSRAWQWPGRDPKIGPVQEAVQYL